MTGVRKMSPEVLIYVQSIKRFFMSNSEAQTYFDIQGNEEKFFQYITEISQKNFEENGEPELTPFQFEDIKRRISKSDNEANEIIGVFISFGNLGHISLN